MWQDMTYALAMPGQMYRAPDPFGPFEAGPVLFNPDMRHGAVLRRGNELLVVWTQVGDAPERMAWITSFAIPPSTCKALRPRGPTVTFTSCTLTEENPVSRWRK